MKVVILAGGKGTRLGSVSGLLPKPMIEVAGKPMIWHIMKIYSYIVEFILFLSFYIYLSACCGPDILT